MRRKSNEYKGKVYWKYSVDITPSLVNELGWEPDTPLEGTVAGDTLILRPQTSASDEA